MSSVALSQSAPLCFRVAERTVWTARRRLYRVGLTLDDLLDDRAPPLPDLDRADGYDLRSWPDRAVDDLIATYPDMLPLIRQRYPRHFLRLDDVDAYWRGFSGKTRSTLRRKRARWAEAAGGLDLRGYHQADQIANFHDVAGALSRLTYQDRLLGAGLPTGPVALAEMTAQAQAGAIRAYILYHRGRPASYLYLPIDDGRVIYAHLGYDPAVADGSPGTVLLAEVLDGLFADPSLRLLDFTEGDGAHKRLFGRESVTCVDLLLLRRGWRNRALIAGLDRFDRAVATAGDLIERWGVKPTMRKLLRG